MKFKIINGTIFDPTQNLNKKHHDIYVENGFITKPTPLETKKFHTTYDANGMYVMAGAIDIHSHIAGGNVNNARLLSPEIHSNFLEHNLKKLSEIFFTKNILLFSINNKKKFFKFLEKPKFSDNRLITLF